jgi:hypothetical protein
MQHSLSKKSFIFPLTWRRIRQNRSSNLTGLSFFKFQTASYSNFQPTDSTETPRNRLGKLKLRVAIFRAAWSKNCRNGKLIVCFSYKKDSLLASENGRNGKQQIFLFIYFPKKAKKLSKENQDTEKEQQHVVFIRRQQRSTRKSHTELANLRGTRTVLGVIP